MQAVILAAGKGTRMGELTRNQQKVLLKKRGSDFSMLENNLRNLPDEIDKAIIVVGFKQDSVRKAIGDLYDGKEIIYVQQKELKGTAHALSLCEEYLSGKFLVLMGDDVYQKADLEKLIEQDLGILVKLQEEDRQTDFLAPIEQDKNGNAVSVVERQQAKKEMLINTGAYVLDKRFFELPMRKAGNKTEEYGLPQTFMQMRDKDIKIVYATSWKKITTPEDLKL